ncbi:MAG: 3,4-dihydroxy-2-butanone-4-phosphate synthase [Actinobacteria bacterium]|uniref:GTP cyclohydrolase II n=1 Tax=freshwater metagenome TaxID=449393 RepID=A0A6J6DUI6_9ZZZZ|nr:3,4-dihydroxy-2-butanone-4-phosphate synthase [Actinomycetota bacterium]
MSNFHDALAAFKRGEMIIVVDDENRENEGDLMMLAEAATEKTVGFMVRHTTGILCVAMQEKRARELRLPLMVEENQDSKQTAFTVSVDVKKDLTTGVSAQERANTVVALASNDSVSTDFIRPGHVFPLIAVDGGLKVRRGHTEAGIALAQLVGAEPLCLLSEIVNEDGSMARGQSLKDFAATHGLLTISIEELSQQEITSNQQASSDSQEFTFDWAQLPLRNQAWQVSTYPTLNQREHAVIKFGSTGTNPLVRIHSECFTGDVLHSQRGDCGDQLELSISLIEASGYGYIIYLRNHEGRGIGLSEKIKAYQLQDQGMDTVEANIALGHQVDARKWNDAVAIVKKLGLKTLTLLTNNPDKVAAIEEAGITCVQRNLLAEVNSFNEKYLATKESKLGHNRGSK